MQNGFKTRLGNADAGTRGRGDAEKVISRFAASPRLRVCASVFFIASLALSLLAGGCATEGRSAAPETGHGVIAGEPAGPESRPRTSPASQPATNAAEADSGDESDETAWQIITTALQRDGARRDAVLVVTVPRDDLFVAIEGMDVPTAAGVESIFNFYHCSCGKTSVVGQFCVADYESNDVIDALRAGHIEVASIGPMVLHSRVNPLLIRFQGEGKAGDLAKTLREALRWTGKERLAPELPISK